VPRAPLFGGLSQGEVAAAGFGHRLTQSEALK
jgi:hypothetical protein